jgi:AGZA family xanthine/uracil permease-like MFS transporter
MLSSILKINFDDYLDAIPAYLCVIAMAFMYSISDGICFGVISYTILHVLAGKAKKVHPLLYVLTILFILKYICL